MKRCTSVVVTCLVTLVSCSGGKDINSSAGNSISGVAAIGAPMSNASVTVRGKGSGAACVASGTANEKGEYSVALSTCAGPYLISAQSSAGTVYSIATDEDVGGRVNITPLTQVIASRVLGTNDLDSVVQNIGTQLANVNVTKINTETNKVAEAVREIAKKYGAEAVDIRKGKFSADGSGIDGVLDAVNVKPSGADLEMEVKGSGGVKITIPASQTAINNANFNSAIADQAKLVTDELVAIKAIMTGKANLGVNKCFDDMDKACFGQYLHSGFLTDGYSTLDDYWHELVDDDESVYIRVGNPVLIEMNGTRDDAWIAADYYEKNDDGVYKKAWLDILRIKKEGGSWKLYGNQNPHRFVIQAAAIKVGSAVEKAFNVRIFDRDSVDDSYVTSIKSDDVGIARTTLTNTVVTYERFKPSINPVSCATDNILCDPFVKQTQAASPLFVKFEVDYDNDGLITADEIQYVISTPPITSEFPTISPSSDLCGNYTESGTSPLNLSWTLPSGHMTESLDAFTQSSGHRYDWNLMGLNDLEYESTSVPLRGSLVMEDGSLAVASFPFNLTYASFMLRTVDPNGRNYYRPKTCGTYSP